MPKHLSAETKAEARRLRIEENKSTPWIAMTLGISNFSAYSILKDLGQWEGRRGGRRAWSAIEERALERLWPMASWAEILAALPLHNRSSITKHASDRGLRRSADTRRRIKKMPDPIFRTLREIRESRGISRNELAERIGMHPTHLSFCELGDNRPRWLLIRAWADALDCDNKIVVR